MALNNQTRKSLESAIDTRATTSTNRSPEKPLESTSQEQEKEQEVEVEVAEEDLELEVKKMAEKILEYRTTLPHQLKNTLSSILSAQRPLLPDIDSGSDPGPAPDINAPGWQGKSSSEAVLQADGNENIAEEVRMVKEKISSNIAAMPVVLKRMKECISKIDYLDPNNGIIHPAFQKKTS